MNLLKQGNNVHLITFDIAPETPLPVSMANFLEDLAICALPRAASALHLALSIHCATSEMVLLIDKVQAMDVDEASVKDVALDIAKAAVAVVVDSGGVVDLPLQSAEGVDIELKKDLGLVFMVGGVRGD